MICKECGAYNPDHANFCKVCAANLKEQSTDPSQEAAPKAEEEQEKVPSFQPRVNRTPSWQKPAVKAAPVVEEVPVAAPVEDEEEEEEEIVSTPKTLEPEESTTRFSRKRRPVIEEEEDDDDEDEEEEEEEDRKPRRKGLFGFGHRNRDEDDEEDDDEDDEEEDDEEEKAPARRKGIFARPSRDDDDDEDDDDDDDDDDDEEEEEEDRPRRKGLFARRSRDDEEDEDDEEEDDEDEYEEYEPTPPRGRKKKNSQGGGVNLVAILLGAVVLIILLMVGIVAYCNLSGGELKGRLPSFLQFNCAGSEDKSQNNNQQQNPDSGNADNNNQQQGAVSGSSIDYNHVDVEETVNEYGDDCFSFKVYLQPGETAIMTLAWQPDAEGTNNNTDGSMMYLNMVIPKSCFIPNTPLESPTYTFTPELYIVSADGTKTLREVEPLTMTFPTVSLSVTTPTEIPAEGIMVDKDNKLHIEGVVDDHNVTVYANDQKLDVYNEGVFMGDYQFTGDVAETVTITASKDNCATTTYSFTVNPYVYIPETMTLTVNGEADGHRAGTGSKLTISGTVSPGSTVTASCENSDIACGSVVVNADGTYSMDVAFNTSCYGLYKITLHAEQEGYEEKDVNCYVSRMVDERKAMITKAFKKRYHEVYSDCAFADVLANPTDDGAYRFAGKVVSVETVDGLEVVCFSAKTAKNETTNIYVINMSEKWKPAEHIGSAYKLYCTLNGLYTDGTSLYVVAWFAMSD